MAASASSRCRPDVCAGSTRLGLETTLIIRADISPGSNPESLLRMEPRHLVRDWTRALVALGTDDIIF
jgi:hypothetical protein